MVVPAWLGRTLFRFAVECALATALAASAVAAGMPLPVEADGPETVQQMEKLWSSAGNQMAGVPYRNDVSWFNPWNWSEGGLDCSSYVAKAWQVREVMEVTENNRAGITTSPLRCTNAYWNDVPRDSASVAKGDVFVMDNDCYPTLEDHAFIYGWGDPCPDTCVFAVFEATTYLNVNRVVHWSRSYPRDYVVKRRSNIAEPGLVGRRDDNSYQGALHQPIVDAYSRNGGAGGVGVPRYNGGGFLVHGWGNGYIQDMEGGSGGAGGLMQPNNRSSRAYWAHGAIRNTYLNNGGAPGWLGYPLSDEYPWHNNCGDRVTNATTNFEGGYIAYNCGTMGWQTYG